jgi:hemerythrin-like domain-containing protein
MRPTEILKEEHVVIKEVLDVLEVIVSDIAAQKPINPEHLEKIVDFIRTFADKCHHGKEQDLLFPAMEEAGIPRDGGPIGVMLEEHDIGRNYVRQLAQAIADYKGGDKKALKGIAENASGYVNLLRQHIDKEDNILYMMADMHLDAPTEKKLLEEFEKVEKRMGEGTHEKYHHLVEELRKKYLRGK